MLSNYINFYINSPLMNELQILNIIKDNANMSQSIIAEKVHLAASMVNNYIKKLELQGYITKGGCNSRNMSYKLTVSGEKRRLFLLITYTSEILSLYKSTKLEFEKKIQKIIDDGAKSIIFYGAGETGEVLMHAVQNLDIEFMGFVDDIKSEQLSDYFGYKLYKLSDIYKLNPDAILISTFSYADEIYKKLFNVIQSGIKVYKI